MPPVEGSTPATAAAAVRVRRVGRTLREHDCFDAGLFRLAPALVFDALDALDARGRYFTLADALDAIATTQPPPSPRPPPSSAPRPPQWPLLRAYRAAGRPWFAVETEEQLEYTRVSISSPHCAGLEAGGAH